MRRAAVLVLVLVLGLVIGLPAAAQKKAGSPWDRAEPLPAPLGMIGGVIEAPPQGGLPGGEKAVVAQLAGCDRSQVLWLTRFLAGAALAGEQLQSWLDKPGATPRGAQTRLFGKARRLEQAVRRAREATFFDGRSCQPLPAIDAWMLNLTAAPAKLCKLERGPESAGGDYWFLLPGQVPGPKAYAGLIRVAPAPEGREDRCRPRISAVLFDDAGRARLRYHADFGGELAVELIGDACQAVLLKFDPQAQGFRATPRRDVGCGSPPNK